MTLTGYILLWSHLSLRQLFLLLVDCAVLFFSSTFCFLGKRKQTLIKRRSLHLTSTQSFKIRRSQKIHILTAPPVRAPAGRGSRPCSRKRSDMMRSARTITRFAPPRCSNPQQFPRGAETPNRRIGGVRNHQKMPIPCRDCSRASSRRQNPRLKVLLKREYENDFTTQNQRGKCTSFHKAPTISSAFAFTEPFVTLPK